MVIKMVLQMAYDLGYCLDQLMVMKMVVMMAFYLEFCLALTIGLDSSLVSLSAKLLAFA